MTARFCSLCAAALGLAAAGTHAATLSFTSALRLIQSGSSVLTPSSEFADFDNRIDSIIDDPDQSLRGSSRASQQSAFRQHAITVVSSIAGDDGRGTSLFKVSFSLDETAAWRLAGTFSLLGGDGFACVSLADLAHLESLLVNQVIFAPPLVSEVRPLLFTGVLPPGNYELEAIIYGGGEDLATQGDINVTFSIPEPGRLLLIAGGIRLFSRRKRLLHECS